MGNHLFLPDKSGVYRMPDKLVGAKAGFIDPTGKFVLAPKYEDVGEFSEGLAGVRINDKRAFIDRAGTIVIPPTFEQVSEFHEGLCAVKIDGWWRYIDKSGNYAIPSKFAGLSQGNFKDGVAEVNPEVLGKAVRIDHKGNILLEQNTFPMSEGLVRFKRNDKYGYRDKDGNEVITPQFRFAEDFSEGLAGVAVPDKKMGFGYIDRSGKFVIPAQYQYGGLFKDGMAHVGFDWGHAFMIDKAGKQVPGFDDTFDENFIEGFIRTRKDGKYGFVNKAGKPLTNMLFDEAQEFVDGHAVVQYGTKYGALDKTGTFIIKPKFDWAGQIREGLIPVRLGGVQKPGPAITRTRSK